MRRSSGLYGPFIIVILIQALVIAVAPSKPASGPTVGGDAGAPLASSATPGAPGQGGTGSGPGTDFGAAPGTDGGTSSFGDSSGGGAGGGAAAGGGTAVGGSGTDLAAGDGGDAAPGSSGSGTQAAQTRSGDTSHCTEDGKQFELLAHAPPCQPKWPQGADNGGATYQGVTGDKVTIVYFRENKNPQVTAILNAEGLRATREQEVRFMEAAQKFVNQNYETYGREVDFVIYDAEECPETPPDPAGCKQEVRKMIKELKPFAAYWPVPTYPTVFDEFARAGVISLGGWHFDNSYFAGRRPYRYDVFMDGTRTADFIGEYYCKKLAGKPATNAGPIIHPRIGARDQVQRRLGIFTQDTEANRLPAERLRDIVAQCDAKPPILLTYESNIDTGAAQAEGNTPKLIEEGVTTIVCMCDPIAPVFRTQDNDQNNYYPEYLMPGSGLLDYDKLGRLYNPQTQWLHAFGPSHLANPLPTNEQDQSKVWQAVGGSGNPCGGACGLHWSYYGLLGIMVHVAGPDLNPLSVEQGLLSMAPLAGWEQTGGDPHAALLAFGKGDYTGVSDIREVYWDNSRNSSIDGRPGSYKPMNGGRRYRAGEISGEFNVPPKGR